jgi:hypothetical protein
MNLLCPLNNQTAPTPWAFAAIRLVVCLAALPPEEMQAACGSLGVLSTPPGSDQSTGRSCPDDIRQQGDDVPNGWTP